MLPHRLLAATLTHRLECALPPHCPAERAAPNASPRMRRPDVPSRIVVPDCRLSTRRLASPRRTVPSSFLGDIVRVCAFLCRCSERTTRGAAYAASPGVRLPVTPPRRRVASKACCLEGAVPDTPSHRAAQRISFRIPCPLRRRLSAGKNLTFLYLRGRFLRLMARNAASCMEKPSLQIQESQFLANSASKCPRRATGFPNSCQLRRIRRAEIQEHQILAIRQPSTLLCGCIPAELSS